MGKLNNYLVSKYIVGIVLVVAVIGVLSLLMTGDSGTTNLSGHATAATCGDGTCARNEARTESCATDCVATDTDSDGLYDYQETYGLYGSTPFTATDSNDTDSDDDGLTDGEEVLTHKTNPTSSDTDSDGLTDSDEVNTYGTSPTSPDTDGDGHGDSPEISLGTDPNDATSYPATLLPDLVIDAATTQILQPTGTAYIVMSNGTIAYSNITVNMTIGVKNQGHASAEAVYKYYTSGKNKYYNYRGSYQGIYLYFGPSYSTGASYQTGDTSFNISVSGSKSYTTKASLANALVYELYINKTVTATGNYTVDYYSYSKSKTSGTTYYDYLYGVNESDETNNNGTRSMSLVSTGITFVAVECATDKDCPTDCGCTDRTTSPAYTCVETTTSGSSTYETTTPCSS